MARTLADKIKAACDRWAESPAKSVAALAALATDCAGNTEDSFAVLEELIPRKEWYNRITRRQMPYHAASLDELFFHHAKAELQSYLKLTEAAMKAPSVSVQMVLRRLMALFAAQDFAQIEKLLPHISPLIGRNIWNTFTTRPTFYETLAQQNDAHIGASFPPVEYVQESDSDGPLIYLSCDLKYYTEFAIPLIRSLAAFPSAPAVHVHVMNASEAEVEAALATLATTGAAFSASCEQLPDADRADKMTARAYFHAVRFVRLYQFMRRRPREVWMLDVDALFNRDPQDLLARRGDADVVLRARPGRFEPWNQLSAAVVGIAPSDRGVAFLRLLAGYIAHFHAKNALAWGVDQLAMFGVFNYLRPTSRAPTIALLDDTAFDLEYRKEGIVWLDAGIAKLGGGAADGDPAKARYYAAFNRYAGK